MKKLMMALSMLGLAGCAGSGGGSGATAVGAPATALPGLMAPAQPGLPSVPPDNASLIFQVTYYSKSFTEAPINGWPTKTYTAIGNCVSYYSKTYCWDDGIKTVTIPAVGNYYYDYWGMGWITQPTNWGPCHGGCITDLMPQPRFISAALLANITIAKINVIFAGTAKVNNCSQSANVLTCDDFSIDLSQTTL